MDKVVITWDKCVNFDHNSLQQPIRCRLVAFHTQLMFPKIFICVDEALSSTFIYSQMFGTNIHGRVMHVIVLIDLFSTSP